MLPDLESPTGHWKRVLLAYYYTEHNVVLYSGVLFPGLCSSGIGNVCPRQFNWINNSACIRRFGDWNPLRIQTSSVSKTSTLSNEFPFVGRTWILLPVHSWQLQFLMLTLPTKISVPPQPVFQTQDRELLVLLTQMVRSFVINTKVWCSSPPAQNISISKFWKLHKNIRLCIANDCCCLCQTQIYYYIQSDMVQSNMI